jgi:hypothetical protein
MCLQTSQGVGYANIMSFDKTLKVLQSQTKFNSAKVLDKHKMVPKRKVQMAIPLFKMISMPIVCPTLKIDVFKIERAF